MKKAGIYILLIFITFNSSVLELCKIPMLFSHFLEHKTNNHVNFVEFLGMHYWGDDLDDDDDDRDMQLPFKKMNAHTFIQFNVPIAKSTAINKQHFSTIMEAKRIPQNYLLPNPDLDTLFRPPRA